jgi:hypothetical protein
MPEPHGPPERRHLIIAGTGRAGTTFLVRYLSAIGLDTHLTRRGERAWLDEAAQAGLEDFPFGLAADDLPYVVKNPMLYEFIDQVLADPTIRVDGVIIPMRDLNDATDSRVILERRSMYEHLPWLGYMVKQWETTGNVPGGLIHSLNPVDEARLLATGFHLLVERLVRANIPFVFLDFPRIVNDADYLYDKLQPLVPAMPEREAAREIYAGIAEPSLVRVTSEPPAVDDRLDGLALRRELVRLREALAAMTMERDEASQAAESANSQLLKTHNELVQTQDAYRALTPALELAERQRALFDVLTREAERLRTQVADFERLRHRAWTDAANLQTELDRATQRLQTIVPELELLKSRTVLLAADLEVAMTERTTLEAFCHRLEEAETRARTRATTAERLLHGYLAAFVDQAGSLVPAGEQVTTLKMLTDRNASLLGQLELTNDDLSETMRRLQTLEAGSHTPQPLEVLARIRRKLRAALPSN